MDRSYIEYSRIVESFITCQGDERLTQVSETSNRDDLDQRMKLAFINVLREEMTD